MVREKLLQTTNERERKSKKDYERERERGRGRGGEMIKIVYYDVGYY